MRLHNHFIYDGVKFVIPVMFPYSTSTNGLLDQPVTEMIGGVVIVCVLPMKDTIRDWKSTIVVPAWKSTAN